MRRLLAAIGTAAVGGGLLAADPPTPEALARQLAAPRFADREAAGRALVQAGPPAVPALTAAAASADPEVRRRAERALDLIRRASESAALTSGKPVALDYRGVPLAAAVADLRKQTGINLTLSEAGVADKARPVTLTAGPTPPWEAVEALCRAAGLREEVLPELPLPATAVNTSTSYYQTNPFSSFRAGPFLTPTAAPVILADGRPDPLPGNRGGGVRVLVVGGRFPANKVVRGVGRVFLHLDVAPLPSTGWQEAVGVRVTRAEDEDGRPLFADLRPTDDGAAPSYDAWGWGGRVMFFAGGQAVFGLDDGAAVAQPVRSVANPRLVAVPLRTDDRAVRRLRRLEGVVVGEVHQPNVPVVTVENLSAAAGKEHDGPNQSRLTVVDYKPQADGSTLVKVRADVPQPWVLQQMRGARAAFAGGPAGFDANVGNLSGQLRFFDAAGRPCGTPSQNGGRYTGDNLRQTFETELRFAKSSSVGPPARMVQIGTRTTTVEVPFRAENVRLP